MERPILIVEDSDEDYEATTWALLQAGMDRPIERCSRADEALRRLQADALSPLGQPTLPPCLMLLDLNLPGMDGRQLLTQVRGLKTGIPVVVLSTSSNPRDVAACYQLGAAGYINKPLTLAAYAEKMRLMVDYWLKTVLLPEATS